LHIDLDAPEEIPSRDMVAPTSSGVLLIGSLYCVGRFRNQGGNNMELLSWLALLLGIFCIGYYFVIILYAGPKVNFSWIWCLGGIGCLSAGAILQYLIITGVLIPGWLLNLAYVLIAIAAVAFLTLEGILIFYSHRTAGKGMNYLLVLGAQINENKVTRNLKKRLDTAIAYLVENPDTLVIVSGGRGSGKQMSEAAVMKAYLIEMGIAGDRITTEDQSINTTENMLYSKELIRKNSSVAIVTNGFHIFRSIRIANKQGIRPVFALVAPTDRLMCLHYYIREAAGILKDGLHGNL
jgi:uncharacterized SAM-binding protein YcdF (DUF218 family)